MNKLIKAFIVTIMLTMSSSSMAVVLSIDFNGTEFLLGTFDSAESGADFYRYDNPSEFSANPVYPGTTDLIPLAADALQIYTHLNTNTNELSFGMILEKPNGSGGGSFGTTATWSTPATLAFVDDPGETGTLGSVGPENIALNWSDCCTDGFVISGFDPDDLFIDLTDVIGSDLTDVVFLSPNRNNTEFVFPSDLFNISISNCNPSTDPNGCIIPTPEPSIIALFAVGLFGLGLARRKIRN